MNTTRSAKPRLSIELLECRALPSGVPTLESWLKASPGEYAQVVSGYNVAAGPSTTWPTNVPVGSKYFGGNSTPVLADITSISYSTNWVYVRAAGLASYAMGPWFLENGSVFPNFPSNQNKLVRISRNPVAAASHTANGLGSIGIWINGVSMFNMLDGFSWSNASKADVGNGDGYWNRDANAAEGPTFDHSHAHQPPSGEYHYHANPTGLRTQLRDNVEFHGGASIYPYDPNIILGDEMPGEEHLYHEMTTALHHSPILGFAYDGFPVYGPYGYSDPNNAASPIARMTTSYQLRSITQRTTLPGWAAKAKFGDSVVLNAQGEYTLGATQYGPAVSAGYPLGWYTEDYQYVAGLGTLDIYNGRFTKTPEYPNGTYAYFVSIDAEGEEAFPYVLGRQYYGAVTSGKITSITEAVTTYYDSTSPPTGGVVRGVTYDDADWNGSRSFSETGRAGVTVFIDANSNGALDAGEISNISATDGSFELAVNTNGSHLVRALTPSGQVRTTANPSAVTVSGGNPVNGIAFGYRIAPPTISAAQINDGTAQRSMVTSLTVNFSEVVNFPTGINSAFTLERTTGEPLGFVNFSAVQSTNAVVITFGGGSLSNGNYRLTILANRVSGAGGAFDGNGDTVAGDNATIDFHRLFGDADGNKVVDQTDYIAFRSAFGAASAIFDHNNDGIVNQADYIAFRINFNTMLP